MNIALCIGINYDGDLNGCENDANKLKECLGDHMGFKKEHVKTLIGPAATHKNIIRELENFAMLTQSGPVDTLFISYSGHGSYQVDHSGDEDDGRDEVLVPYDHKTAGMIKDDEIHSILKMVSANTTVVSVFDCCHSGTIFDLPFRYIQGDKSVHEHKQKEPIQARCIMLSGCSDTQQSGETWADGQVLGALTTAFLIVLQEHQYNITCWNLLRKIRSKLSDAGYGFQVPQLTTTEQLHGTYPFISNQDNTPFLEHH